MKLVIVSLFFLCVAFQTHAQQNQEKLFYLQKIEKYRKMKSTGAALSVVGTGLVVYGIVTLSNATTSVYGYNQTNDKKVTQGVIAYLAGVGCMGAGIPLWIVGGIKHGKYNEKLERATRDSFSLNVSPANGGLSVSYRF